MKTSAYLAPIAMCLIGLMPLSGCGGKTSPVDAALQVDDYVAAGAHDYRKMPIERLTPLNLRNFKGCTATINALKRQPQPEMMAIGGSVFNGVSSMQINWWLSDWSPPAQVARALHGKMTGTVPGMLMPPYPDYGADPFAITGPNATLRLGLDLETMGLSNFPTTIRHQGTVMERFRDYTASGKALSDNLSFGGAAVEDILYGTPRDYRARLMAVRRIDTIEPNLDDFWGSRPRARTYGAILEHAKNADIKNLHTTIETAKTAAELKTIFFALNSAFVLNPARDECLEDLTALDQVLLRQPKRLLVGAGANSGLFTFLYTGQPVRNYCGETQFSFGKEVREWKRYVTIKFTSGDEFLARMKILLDKLDTEGKGIEHIYVMGQLRPRVVANIQPDTKRGAVGIDSLYPPNQLLRGPDGYHDEYTLGFAPDGGRRIPGGDLKEADDLNTEVNKKLRTMVEAHNKGSERRFVFVDLSPIEQHDVRHKFDDGTGKQVPGKAYEVTDEHLEGLGSGRKILLDNMALTFVPGTEKLEDGTVIGQKIHHGGMFGLDNLHPTVVGYAALATELLKAIIDTEHPTLTQGASAALKSISPQAAYARFAGQPGVLDGNVLHRRDNRLITGREGLQVAFDARTSLSGSNSLDCWPDDRQPAAPASLDGAK